MSSPGTGEKGQINLEIVVQTLGGHSSIPREFFRVSLLLFPPSDLVPFPPSPRRPPARLNTRASRYLSLFSFLPSPIPSRPHLHRHPLPPRRRGREEPPLALSHPSQPLLRPAHLRGQVRHVHRAGDQEAHREGADVR